MKTNKVARLLYVDELPKKSSDAPPICTMQDMLTPNPVFVLPADEASIEKMREAAHDAVCREFTSPKGPPGLKDYSDAVLAALGLTAPTQGRRK